MAEEEHESESNPIWGIVAQVGGVLLLVGFVLWLIATNVPAATSLLLLGIGIGGAASLLMFAWGFSVYIARLGNENRAEGIHLMAWGVTILFGVIVLGGILRFLESYLA